MAMPRRCERVIFVVDDDETIRESVAYLLLEEGYQVVTAGNGAEALDKLRRSPVARPCLILIDLMMPVMNGHEFIEHQQADLELISIPVVIMSANGNLQEDAIPCGSECLAKPVSFEIILATIARHCGGGHTIATAVASLSAEARGVLQPVGIAPPSSLP